MGDRVSRLAEVLSDLHAEGWTTGSEHDPGCPGDEHYCMTHCPVPVQVRLGPDDLAAALVAADEPATVDVALTEDERESTLTVELLANIWRDHSNCNWLSDGENVRWNCGIVHPGPIYMQPTTRDRHVASLIKTQVDAEVAILAARLAAQPVCSHGTGEEASPERSSGETPAPEPRGETEVSVAIRAQNPDLDTAWQTIARWEQTCDWWRTEAQKGYALRDAPAGEGGGAG